MPKYQVEGRIRCDIDFEETVEAKSIGAAIKSVEQKIYKRVGITVMDVIDDEIYAEEIK